MVNVFICLIFRFLAWYAIVTIRKRASTIPGTIPAINSLPMDVDEQTPYIIMVMLGGMMTPRAPATAWMPATKSAG